MLNGLLNKNKNKTNTTQHPLEWKWTGTIGKLGKCIQHNELNTTLANERHCDFKVTKDNNIFVIFLKENILNIPLSASCKL